MPIGEPQVAIWRPQLCEEVVQLKAVLNNLDQYGAYRIGHLEFRKKEKEGGCSH